MITVYSKPSCPYCVKAKAWLSQNGIEFRDIDVSTDADSLAFIKSEGHRTVPQIYVGRRLLVAGGFSGLSALSPDEVRARCGEAA